ncbi:MAG: HIT domain-containing protein [Oscillospiraceae bacterium]|jgi:histidine triad (HIT) family protein|nr:HIT domain-containing protein [Oscillospiraceae bacterium]
MDCIFCKIIQKEIKSEIIFEDDLTLCFKDLKPVSPVHLLIVPKIHITSLFEVDKNNSHYISKIFENIPKISMDICENGFRVVNNNGEDALQSVEHLHFHILGGRQLGWPPC